MITYIDKNMHKFILLIFCSLLLSETNKYPYPFIEKLLPPISLTSNITFSYSTVAIIIIIFYLTKSLIFYFTKTKNILIISIVVIFIVSSLTNLVYSINTNVVLPYQNNLNSIYCLRENMSISIMNTDLIVDLNLENLSNVDQEFFIEVQIPKRLTNEQLNIGLVKQKVQIAKGKSKHINIVRTNVLSKNELENQNPINVSMNYFKFNIYNEHEIIKFY